MGCGAAPRKQAEGGRRLCRRPDKRDAGHLQGGDSPAPNTRTPPSATSGPTRRFFCLAGVYSPYSETACKSPHSAPAGSTGSTAGTPWVSSLSARCSSMSRLPLLRRTTAEMPIFLSASRFCRICLDTFLGEIRSTPTGSIRSDSSVGVPINTVLVLINAEMRTTIRSS